MLHMSLITSNKTQVQHGMGHFWDTSYVCYQNEPATSDARAHFFSAFNLSSMHTSNTGLMITCISLTALQAAWTGQCILCVCHTSNIQTPKPSLPHLILLFSEERKYLLTEEPQPIGVLTFNFLNVNVSKNLTVDLYKNIDCF